jgi:hypothetical protein
MFDFVWRFLPHFIKRFILLSEVKKNCERINKIMEKNYGKDI